MVIFIGCQECWILYLCAGRVFSDIFLPSVFIIKSTVSGQCPQTFIMCYIIMQCIVFPWFCFVFPAQNLTLHYLTDGSCSLQFSKNKQLFYVPVVLIMKVSSSTIRYCTITLLLYNRFIKSCLLKEIESSDIMTAAIKANWLLITTLPTCSSNETEDSVAGVRCCATEVLSFLPRLWLILLMFTFIMS